MERLQIASVLAAAALLLVVFELVRRRRLQERYALLWLFSALVLVVLAAWRGLLEEVSSAVGIATPSNALFAVAFGFVLLLLLHFSLVISKLAEQNAVLAQQAALLRQQLEQGAGDGGAAPRLLSGSSAAADERR